MLLAAQVPWVACPTAEANAFFPALGGQAVHEHVHGGHHGSCSAHGHHHGHTHDRAPAPRSEQDGPTIEPLHHVHGLLCAELVIDASAAELPAPQAVLALGIEPVEAEEAVRAALAAGREPPPPRPPSAACIEDNVRLLS